MKRRAFTLIEMLISITILAIMMLFLYKSYASLNLSNEIYKKETENLIGTDSLKRTLFLDFSLSLYNSVKIENLETYKDVVFMQSTNSNHKKYNPYVAYILKEKKLYRLESLKAYTGYPLGIEDEFTVDFLGEVDIFRVYKDLKKEEDIESVSYLIHIKFREKKEIIFKVKALNEY